MIFHDLIWSHSNAEGKHGCLPSMLQYIPSLFLSSSSSNLSSQYYSFLLIINSFLLFCHPSHVMSCPIISIIFFWNIAKKTLQFYPSICYRVIMPSRLFLIVAVRKIAPLPLGLNEDRTLIIILNSHRHEKETFKWGGNYFSLLLPTPIFSAIGRWIDTPSRVTCVWCVTKFFLGRCNINIFSPQVGSLRQTKV